MISIKEALLILVLSVLTYPLSGYARRNRKGDV